MTDTTLEGGVSELFPPDDHPRSRLRKSVRTMADGKHVAIVADEDAGPDGGLVSVFRSMLSLAGLGRTRPPPTLLISDPLFDVGDDIRVPVDETHLENVFIQAEDVEML